MYVTKFSKLHFCIAILALPFSFITCKKKVTETKITPIPTIVLPATSSTFDFVHPSILTTKSSLDLIAAEIEANNAERSNAFKKILDYTNVASRYPTSFPSIVIVGSNGATTPSKDQIRQNAELAYATALRWAATGDSNFAKQTIAILNGWASAFQAYDLLVNPTSPTNPNQPSLEASWTTPTMVAAAEIMRYYKPKGASSGWLTADITKFESYLTKLLVTINKTPVYNNNWNVSAGYAKMTIGIFLNTKTIYDEGVNYIKKYLPIVISVDGTIDELCDRKDCVHFQYSLTGFTYAAELARIQGDVSIYTYGNNLISLGYNFMKNAYDRTGCNYCSTTSPVFPGTEVAYNYYKTPTLKALRELQAPLALPNDNTFLGFTSYTHFNVKLN
ncbi:alginate lyase family protein [Pedobacter sp. Du54]|uniref:alginate lyase family protein n=1 Tax=Pedobacter anseongensis TaxID=3133439 RepID=UPI0030A6043E